MCFLRVAITSSNLETGGGGGGGGAGLTSVTRAGCAGTEEVDGAGTYGIVFLQFG